VDYLLAVLLPQLLHGLVFGAALGLLALGLTVIFGLLGVMNFAHGELFMLGAYVVVAAKALGLPFWLGALAAPLLVGLAGLAIEVLLIRHVYRRPLDTILATWGLSIAIKQAVVLTFGPAAFSVPLPVDATLAVGAFAYPVYRLILTGLALAIIGATFWLFLKTDFGLIARAVIARPQTAAALGIDTRRVMRASFVLGTGLAGLAGALVAPLISVDPQMGLGYLVPAFLAILIGGAGPLAGVLVGGTLVCGVDSLLTLRISPVAAQIAVLALAVVAIRLRPTGIFGGRGDR
jgi:urea transport system permease protein